MTAIKLSEALGNVGERYITEAVTYTQKRKKSAWVKWVSLAACLFLIISGCIFGYAFRSSDKPDVPKGNVISYFTITAHAADGESTELSFADSCFNSGTSECNIFGIDMPVFSLTVEPSDLKTDEAIYERFDISISYCGKPVKDKDEHIRVCYLIYAQPSSKPGGYSVVGWFTEPTDVVVTITDKESKAVVEEIIVNVKYDSDRQEYELKIASLHTEYAKQ